VTTKDIQDLKRRGEKIPVLTAYDYTTAKLVEGAGIQVLLVGDTLGQVVLGYDTTVPVTMDEMVHHIRAVARGARKAHIIGDMPFMSYQADQSDAVRNAGRMLKEGGCQSVKLEGGRTVARTVSRIVQAGIPVMGHIGLTPQAVNQLGGYRVQGKTPDDAARLLDDALALQDAGAYALVIELVPTPLSELISNQLMIPTIGIGAGAGCDGQVQVLHDMLGLFDDFVPKHARRFAQLGAGIRSAVEEYIADVQALTFPSDDESFKMEQAVVEELEAATSRP
jgi:3-methyl-2-oxobutanoate hydroxymethyltransferase